MLHRYSTTTKLASFATVAATFLVTACCHSHNVGSVVGDLGFNEIRPPVDYLDPGTVVRIITADPLVVGVVCTKKSAVGDAALLDSATETQKWQQ